MTKKQRIIVNGALGKMGRETLKAVAGYHHQGTDGSANIQSASFTINDR
jgi:dihydrodipicolinate reductase